MADETNWLGFPVGDHWLDASLERAFYTDVDEIDDMVDEDQIDLAQRVLKNFPKPKTRKQLAEWYNVKARIQAKKRNYNLALRLSRKAIQLNPKNSRYKVVYNDTYALMLFEKVQQDYGISPSKKGFLYGLHHKVERFIESIFQSAFFKLYSFYSRLSSLMQKPPEEQPPFTETQSASKYYKFDLEYRIIGNYDKNISRN